MGRTLDYEFSYGEKITVVPRNYPLELRHGGSIPSHYAIIGMAHIADNYPLYYDAVNEMGLGIAGLNFVGNAIYGNVKDGCWIRKSSASRIKSRRPHGAIRFFANLKILIDD